MKRILKLDYSTWVHLFWTVLLLVVIYHVNRSYKNYIAECSLYDFEFSRAGVAGLRMAFIF